MTLAQLLFRDMSKDTRQVITDAERIRALAHPLRLELLDYLDGVGQATATECAAHTGESVANCSFHLRVLAKAGFIEPAERQGREKPWRAAATSRMLDVDPENPSSLHAVREVVGLSVLREAERFRQFMAENDTRPDGWEDTVTLTTARFWATAEEMRELVETVHDLTERFAGRAEDPSLRPDGARPGRLVAMVNPESFPGPDDKDQS